MQRHPRDRPVGTNIDNPLVSAALHAPTASPLGSALVQALPPARPTAQSPPPLAHLALELHNPSGPQLLTTAFEYLQRRMDLLAGNPPLTDEPEQPVNLRLGLHDVECSGCMDKLPLNMAFARLLCDCWYCLSCFNELFQTACASTQNYPPTCCGNILSLADWGRFLTPETRARYEEAKAEFDHVPSFYCASPRCSAVIPKERIVAEQQFRVCPACDFTTCALCKKLMTDHIRWDIKTRICPEDENEAKLLELGKRSKWNKCPSCLNMVEKNFGCSHINCICGADFCYRCGQDLNANDVSCRCYQDDYPDDSDEDEEGSYDVGSRDDMSSVHVFYDDSSPSPAPDQNANPPTN